MDAGTERALLAKGVLPVRAETLCELLGPDCRLQGVDPQCSFSKVVVTDLDQIVRGCLFIPFLETDEACVKKVSLGALAVLTDHVIEGAPAIVVPNLTEALYKICAWMFKAIELPSIVVAGSEGKTTTKRMVKRVLQQQIDVFSQDHNYNTLQSLCRALQEVETSARMIVQEVDESRGRNTVHCSTILKPDIVLVTNIAEAHIGRLGGKENLVKSFLGLTAGLRENGYVILNADDQDSMEAGFNANILTVGINNQAADCLATGIQEKAGGIAFDVSFQGKTTHIKLSVHGTHNVYNAMMAFLVGKLKGVPEKKILKGLRSFRNSGIRQNIVKLGNVLIYADCYNASLTSVKYALKCFCELPRNGGKRIAVFGDITGIAGFEDDTYGGIAKLIDQSNLDGVITYGNDSKMILERVTKTCMKKHTSERSGLNAVLKELNQKDDNSYLFKASGVMELDKSIQAVFPQHYRIMCAQERERSAPKGVKTMMKDRMRLIDAARQFRKSR